MTVGTALIRQLACASLTCRCEGGFISVSHLSVSLGRSAFTAARVYDHQVNWAASVFTAVMKPIAAKQRLCGSVCVWGGGVGGGGRDSDGAIWPPK